MRKKIGFIGLGNMGLPMALNLCRKGFEVVVCSSKRESQQKIIEAGGGSAVSLQAMAETCDVIITIVPADQEILSLYGPDGILLNARPGLTCIDMTSAKGTTKISIAQYIEQTEKHLQFIDAPVSGGTAGAKAGTLTIMVGGTEEQYRENMDIFRAMGKTILYTGPVGSASNIKMLNQMLNAANTAIAAEVLCISKKLGIDDRVLSQVIGQSSGSSFVFEKNVPRYMMTDDHTPGFRLRLMKKDVGLFLDTSKEIGGFTPVSGLVYELYQAVSNHGGQDKNYTYIYQWLKENQKN